MGFAVIRTEKGHPNGRVTWMQEGNTPPGMFPDSRLVRVPDSFVAEHTTEELIEGNQDFPPTTIKSFDVTPTEVDAVGCDPDVDLAGFLTDFVQFASDINLDLIRRAYITSAIHSAILISLFPPLLEQLEILLGELTSTSKAALTKLITKHKISVQTDQSSQSE